MSCPTPSYAIQAGAQLYFRRLPALDAHGLVVDEPAGSDAAHLRVHEVAPARDTEYHLSFAIGGPDLVGTGEPDLDVGDGRGCPR